MVKLGKENTFRLTTYVFSEFSDKCTTEPFYSKNTVSFVERFCHNGIQQQDDDSETCFCSLTVPLIIVNSACIVLLLVFGWQWDTRVKLESRTCQEITTKQTSTSQSETPACLAAVLIVMATKLNNLQVILSKETRRVWHQQHDRTMLFRTLREMMSFLSV